MEELCERWLQAVAEMDAGLMVSQTSKTFVALKFCVRYLGHAISWSHDHILVT